MFSTLRKFGVNLGRLYNSALTRHPYTVQITQVSFLMGAGDVLAQTVVERKPLNQVDTRRTLHFAGLGCFIVGPFLTHWYRSLDRIVKTNNALKRTVMKMTLDQLLFAPFLICVITTTLSALQGMNKQEIFQRLKTEYPKVLFTNYCIWPAAQMINFGLIPLNYQVIFVQFVAIIWNTYLSTELGKENNVIATEKYN